jgi:hypothetical protein
MPRREQHPASVILYLLDRAIEKNLPAVSSQSLPDNLRNVIPLREAYYRINAFNFRKEFFANPLRQAAGHDDFPDHAGSLILHSPFCYLKGFDLRRLNESTSIYYNDLGLVKPGRYHKIRLSNFCQHFLAVHHIFGTAQCDKTHCYHILIPLFSHIPKQ